MILEMLGACVLNEVIKDIKGTCSLKDDNYYDDYDDFCDFGDYDDDLYIDEEYDD